MIDKRRKRGEAKLSLDLAQQRLKQGFEHADVARATTFDGMVTLKRAKLVKVRRERGRLEAKHGRKDARIATLDRQMAAEHAQLTQARQERDRIAARPVERKENAWAVHGHVRDADAHALEDYRVGLYSDEKARTDSLAETLTDDCGHYALSLEAKAAAAAAGDVKTSDVTEVLVLEPKGSGAPPVYLGVHDRSGKLVCVEPRALRPRAGGLVYRDVKLAAVTRTGKENYPTRLLGNSSSRELHDLDNEKPACDIAAIAPDRRVYFKTAPLAKRAGYDFCGHCFGRSKSKR